MTRRVWFLLAALPVLAFLFTVIYSRVETQRIRREVEVVVARQDQTVLEGDWTALRGFYADDTLGWADQQVKQLQTGGFPAPIALPGLVRDAQPGLVRLFQVIGSQLVRADVVRTFHFVSGGDIRLALPQFYQFTAGAWRQVAPPRDPAAQVLQLHGTRVDVTYYATDSDLAASLVHDLDDVVTKACADWECPSDLRVPVRFVANDPTFQAGRPYDTLLGSLTFQTIFAYQPTYLWRQISLSSRLQGGYPADAPAAAAVRRAASAQALLVVAQRLAPKTILRGANVYLDALVVREAVRLGLEPARLAEAKIANTLFTPDEPWLMRGVASLNASAWPETLVIVNQLLQGRTVADEARLMQAFDGAKDVHNWLVAGLGLTPEAATTRLAAAAAFDTPVPSVLIPGFVPDLALTCPDGPVLASLDGRTAPLFGSDYPDSTVSAWSPDGRRLALAVSDRRAVVDLTTGSGIWLPRPMHRVLEGTVSWASNTVLVYPPAQRTARPQYQDDLFQTSSLAFFDVESGGYLAPLDQYNRYFRSPNGQWAAVLGGHYGPEPSLAIIPALGEGPVLTTTAAENAAWAPDSRHLIYSTENTSRFGLVVLDLDTGTARTVLTSQSPGVPPVATDGSFIVQAVWSPDGEHVAVLASFYAGGRTGGWAGLMDADGTGFHVLPLQSSSGIPFSVSFSADGQYLELDESNAGQISTEIRSPLDGHLLRSVPGYWSAGWSTKGHSLALNSRDGVSLLREPSNLEVAPQSIGPVQCRGVAWR